MRLRSCPDSTGQPSELPHSHPPSLPQGGKKKTANKSKKDKPTKPQKKKGRATTVSDTDLYAMMHLVAGRHGWSLGESPRRPPPPGLPPQFQPLLPWPRRRLPWQASTHGQVPLSRAPAALGAPPGEEAFPPQAPTMPMGFFARPEGSIISDTSESDWSSLPEPAPADFDVWSVTSGALSLAELEAAPGMKHLSEEAEVLLLRYLKEFYTVQLDAAAQQSQPSMLFRSGAEPDPGIPHNADFRREYERIVREPPPRGLRAH